MKDTKVISITTEYSSTALKSGEIVEIRPGTDPTRALGVAGEIIEEKRYDEIGDDEIRRRSSHSRRTLPTRCSQVASCSTLSLGHPRPRLGGCLLPPYDVGKRRSAQLPRHCVLCGGPGVMHGTGAAISAGDPSQHAFLQLDCAFRRVDHVQQADLRGRPP